MGGKDFGAAHRYTAVHFKAFLKQIGTLLIPVVFICQKPSVVNQMRWGDGSPRWHFASCLCIIRGHQEMTAGIIWCCQCSSSSWQVHSCKSLFYLYRSLTQLLNEQVLLTPRNLSKTWGGLWMSGTCGPWGALVSSWHLCEEHLNRVHKFELDWGRSWLSDYIWLNF